MKCFGYIAFALKNAINAVGRAKERERRARHQISNGGHVARAPLPALRNTKLKCICYILLIFTLLGGIVLIPPITKPKLLEDIDFSQAFYDRNNRLLRLTITNDEKYRLYTALPDINQTMVNATLLKEDEYFYHHHGVNPWAIGKAFWQTYIQGQSRRGASTITMQVARLRYKLATRTITGKLKQIALAFVIEQYYTKDQILEAYFNLAPYGNNIEGVGAASLIYYHMSSHQLTLPQALTLSVIPQRPGKRSLDNLNYSWIIDSRKNLFQRYIEKYPQFAHYEHLLDLPIANFTRSELPYLAPHFVDTLIQGHHTNASNVNTTLNINFQQIINKSIKQSLEGQHYLGIDNAAALLVDVEDLSILAQVGSADFFNNKINGQINGTRIKRSPGSTLKPFIYGLAIDQSLIHPATILKDAPMSFGSYNPENFDYDFVGPISARDALVQSRNIPAVYLANRLENPSLYDFLTELQIPLFSEEYYGLALALGGAEITMEELLELYAMLANQGMFHHFRFLKHDKLDKGQRALSPEASFLVLNMLKGKDNTLAVKTGTSSGYRDAWAVGIWGHYALAVWVGQFKGQGNPAFTGRTAALPLLTNIVEALAYQSPQNNFITDHWLNLNLVTVPVCKASGMLPTSACPETIETWYIPGKSPIKKDNIYRQIMINPATGLRACKFNADYPVETFEFWPSDLLKIFKAAGIKKRTPPEYDSDCQIASNGKIGNPPKITSPKMNVSYAAHCETLASIPLSTTVTADVSKIHWFVNESYIGHSNGRDIYWWQAKPGKYTIRAVDNFGRADTIVTKVVKVCS